MNSLKHSLLGTAAMVPIAFGLTAGGAMLVVSSVIETPQAQAACTACNPCAAAKKAGCGACNPCAAAKAAACTACNPCAAAKAACNPCNPCAATKAAACNPCAAAKAACNPCNPCAATKAAACNPCAAAKAACNPCNPCAAAKAACNPCNPCAAKNPCNPCAAKNPCGAAACNPCNPCGANAGLAATDCYVPRLKTAAACNPCAAAKAACSACNPCAAAKTAAACNPCAAAKAACNPCNPCAAKNPCAAAACNPCNPCAASAPEVQLSAEELTALYDCLKPKMAGAYTKGEHWAASKWSKWQGFAKHGYRSETHGGRFVLNYANKLGAATYAKYDAVKAMPIGSTLAKPSFVVGANGQASMGPLFVMEKMTRGWNGATADWRYAMIMPNGSTFGVTKAKNSGGMEFCHTCHSGGEDNDYMLFLPEEYRN